MMVVESRICQHSESLTVLFLFDSIRVVVTVEQTELELDKAASLIREAAESVLN